MRLRIAFGAIVPLAGSVALVDVIFFPIFNPQHFNQLQEARGRRHAKRGM
jgi:hypothetical protein